MSPQGAITQANKIKSLMDTLLSKSCGPNEDDPIVKSGLLPPGSTNGGKIVADPDDVNKISSKIYNNQKQILRNKYQKEVTDRLSGPQRLKLYETEYNNYLLLANPNSSAKTIQNNIRETYRDLYNKYSEIAKNIQEKSLQENELYMNEINSRLNNYDSEESYSTRMINVLEIEQKRNNDLELELQNLISGTNTNNRKVIYEEYDLGIIKSTRKILFYVYYLLFILYLVFGRFLSEQEYRNIYVWVGIVLYITLPFYIRHITNALVYAYRQFIYMKNNKFSKNVYLDI